MNITTELQTIATNNGAIPLVYGTEWQINKELDKVASAGSFPLCIMFQPSRGSFSMQEPYGSALYERVHVALGYADTMRFDYDAQQLKTKAENLKAQCVNLVRRLNKSGKFAQVTNVNYELMPNRDDANLLICLIELDLQEVEGGCLINTML